MARTFQNFTESPKIQRQRNVAQLLRQGASQPLQGQMVSGHYVGPSLTQGLNQLFQGFASGRLENLADEREKTQRNQLAEALRGTEAPPVGIRSPDYEPEPLVDRLAGLTDNPQAQQMAMALRLREATQEPAKPINVNGKLIDPNDPTRVIADYSEPKAPGMLMQNEQGQWVPNPAYIDAKSRIAEAGSDKNTFDFGNMMGGAPELGKLSTDYGYVLDDQGKPIISQETGLPVAAPIPGSKEYRSLQEKQQSAEEREDVQTITDAEKSGAMMDATGKIIDLIEESNIPATGTLSRPFALYSGSPAGRVRSLVGPLKSGVALNAMMRLKNASATGATGFGQMNKKELQLLIDDIGALDPDTTEPDIFLDTVKRIRDRYQRVVNDIKANVSPEKIEELGLEPIIRSFDEQGAAANEQSDQPPEGVDPEDWKFMTPEERALFR